MTARHPRQPEGPWTRAGPLWYTASPSRPVDRAAHRVEVPSKVKAMSQSVKALEAPANPNVPALNPGDTVSVHVRIREGDRERIQEFRGTVIRLRKGGSNANFTVRRTAAHGVGVERTFLMRSPLIEKIEVQRQARVRRAQLYYLRERTGKRARLIEKRKA